MPLFLETPICITHRTLSTLRYILIPWFFDSFAQTQLPPSICSWIPKTGPPGLYSWCLFYRLFLCSNLDSFKTGRHTPPKTNISPEKCWLEDKPFLLKCSLFRWHVNFRGCIFPGAGTPTVTMNKQLPLESSHPVHAKHPPSPRLPPFMTDFL